MHIDRLQFNEIYAAHAQTVFKVAYSYVRNRQTAEDIVQNVFLKLLLSNTDVPLQQLKYWLIRVAINQAKDELRKQKRTCSLPENIAQSPCKEEYLADIVGAMKEKYRQVIVLYYYQGMTCSQVAQTLKISTSAVLKRLERARSILKEIIGEDL